MNKNCSIFMAITSETVRKASCWDYRFGQLSLGNKAFQKFVHSMFIRLSHNTSRLLTRYSAKTFLFASLDYGFRLFNLLSVRCSNWARVAIVTGQDTSYTRHTTHEIADAHTQIRKTKIALQTRWVRVSYLRSAEQYTQYTMRAR